MARAITERDRVVRARWKAFLTPRVGVACPVSIRELGEKLGELTGRTGDLRADIYAYLDGRQTVSADRAYYVGEALRECGDRRCSGPLALYAAGHDATLIAYLAQLAEHGAHTTAVDLYAALPLAVEVEIDAFLDGSNIRLDLGGSADDDGRPLAVNQARDFIAASLARLDGPTREKAFDRASQVDPMRGIRSAVARTAYDFARRPLLFDRARAASWLALDEWQTGFNEPRSSHEQRVPFLRDYRFWRERTDTFAEQMPAKRAAIARDEHRTPAEGTERKTASKSRRKTLGENLA